MNWWNNKRFFRISQRTKKKKKKKKKKKNLKEASKKQEQFANKHRSEAPNFKPGAKVWLNSSLVIQKGNKKLRTRKLGPFKIIKKISPVSYQLELLNNLKIHCVIHVSELEPYYEENFGRKQEPPPPISINEEEEFEVEEILDVRKQYEKNTISYKMERLFIIWCILGTWKQS